MTNPESYFREAERLEAEMFDRCNWDGAQSRTSILKRPIGRGRMYSRETLPSGCILYLLRAEKTMICAKTETPAPESLAKLVGIGKTLLQAAQSPPTLPSPQ